ncbi:hypothetical protein JCM5296_001224 [Sporobolomyces johnsonii]
MRASIIFAAALTAAQAVFAQTAAGVPSCVVTCISNSAALTTCASSDAYCLCSANAFIDGITACMVASCSTSDLAFGVSFGESYCQSVGVTIVIPSSLASQTAAASTATDASASTTAAATTTSSAASTASSSSSSSSSSSATATGTTAATVSNTSTSGASALVSSASLLAFVGASAAFFL